MFGSFIFSFLLVKIFNNFGSEMFLNFNRLLGPLHSLSIDTKFQGGRPKPPITSRKILEV